MDLTNENEQLEPELTEEERVIAQANEEMELFGTMLGAITVNEVCHQAVRAVVLPKVYGLTQEITDMKKENEDIIANANLDNLEFEREISQLREEITRIKAEHYTEMSQIKSVKHELELVAEDRATKLENCYNQLTEAKNTIDELNAKLAVATAPKIPVKTNVEGAHYIKPEKRAIYDVEYIGQFKNKYKAKFADTDESFEDFTVYKDAKYKEVTAEEAPSFRIQEPVSTDDQRSSKVEDLPIVYPSVDSENTFREEEESIGSELATESSSVVGSFITEERINSIETRLAKVEGMLRL